MTTATATLVLRVRPAAQRLGVDLGVAFTFVTTRESATADVARERLFTGMSAQVSRQVVGPAERPRAHLAAERLLSGVNSHVTRQLVAT